MKSHKLTRKSPLFSSDKARCNKVPCGSCNPYCKPSYCYNKRTISTKNWCVCNMLNVSNKTKRANTELKKRCVEEKRHYKPKPSDEDEHTIPVDVLNKKMPYIWRFLRQGTKKEILRLAELDVNEINIPFNVYDSPSNSKYKKQIKTLKKKYKDI